MWDLPGPGIEPMSPALAGEVLTTGPPGKSRISVSYLFPNWALDSLSPVLIFNDNSFDISVVSTKHLGIRYLEMLEMLRRHEFAPWVGKIPWRRKW